MLYLFYDAPELLHEMMKVWLELSITCLTKVQDCVPFFELRLGEDIAFKNKPLISPEMADQFLMPYYRELFQTLRSRQKEFMQMKKNLTNLSQK